MINKKLRSLLFIPSHIQKFYPKIDNSNADAIVFDLEDSVPPISKAAARKILLSQFNSTTFKEKKFYIRTNSTWSAYFADDMDLVHKVNPCGIIVPKISSVECLAEVSKYLSSNSNVEVFGLIESALAIMNLKEICSSGKKNHHVSGLVFGHEDYLNDIDAFSSDEMFNLSFARASIICAAKAFELVAIDSPYLNLNDNKGLSVYARRSFITGFDGMLVLHPRQVDTVNCGFTPSVEDIEEAEAIVSSSRSSIIGNRSISYINGRFAAPPLLKRSKALLAKAKLFGILK